MLHSCFYLAGYYSVFAKGITEPPSPQALIRDNLSLLVLGYQAKQI